MIKDGCFIQLTTDFPNMQRYPLLSVDCYTTRNLEGCIHLQLSIDPAREETAEGREVGLEVGLGEVKSMMVGV